MLLGCSQVVRQRFLVPCIGGSNPSTPTSFAEKGERMASFSLLCGSSHLDFAREIASYLQLPLNLVDIHRFPDGELSVQIPENVRGHDVFIVQTIARDPHEYLMELLLSIDACKRASARSIAAVIPYYGYARQDRKDRPRVPISAKLIADLLTVAGISRVLTMDLHAGQIQGFFNIPVDNLFARPLLAGVLKECDLKNPVIIAPDLGAIKKARAYASHLKADFALIDKRRVSFEKVEAKALLALLRDATSSLLMICVQPGGLWLLLPKLAMKRGQIVF